MSFWGSLNLQNGVNSIMECIIYFHDYMMMILSMILVFVTYFMIFNILNKHVDKLILESHFLEFIWTVIPMVILLFMAYPSLMMLYFMENSEINANSFNFKVIAHQWYWEYEYQTENTDININSFMKNNPSFFYMLETTDMLYLPLNYYIQLYITSSDVIHSFTIPSFGVKVDAIPGRMNMLNFNINMPGIYYGQCSEICGSNHSFMPIQVMVY